MCGFAGAIHPSQGAEQWSTNLRRMARALKHRGPDDEGIWYDPSEGIGLVHRRLSILDLSPEGHQPMVSASGRYVIAYNGEVYNFATLREELAPENPIWRGHSDTEVILAAIDAWGIERAVRRFGGIFALALWDKKDRALYLVRDQIGVKPLYYGWSEGAFLFGSELKALRAHSAFANGIDRDAVALMIRHSYVPAPYSIFEGIFKVEPGTILRVPIRASGHAGDTTSRTYWCARTVTESGQAAPLDENERALTSHLECLLRDTIRAQMVSDVPLGAFLSGGIDSTTVVALMQEQSTNPVKTFTIGFTEEGFDEAPHAKAVARHLGTDHTELYVSPEQAMGVIPEIPTVFDEPFSDPSQLPTLLVSKLARSRVTVTLSGDGGDELFGGYDRYATARRLWGKVAWMPRAIRRSVFSGLQDAPESLLGMAVTSFVPWQARAREAGDVGARLKRHARRFRHGDRSLFYRDLVSHWESPTEVVIGAVEPATKFTAREYKADLGDSTHQMMYMDTISYLPDDILVKVDRASMSVGLEARVPLLDHRIVEFAWRLPLSVKVRNGHTKWILKEVLHKFVPRGLVDRPKKGFSVPLNRWLRGPLRDWAENLLSQRRLKEDGIFAVAPIRQVWQEHLAGHEDWDPLLWDVLMFQSWLDAQGRYESWRLP